MGTLINQEQKLSFETSAGPGEHHHFKRGQHVLVIDDFTNSGSTLFGAVSLCSPWDLSSRLKEATVSGSMLKGEFGQELTVGTQKRREHHLKPGQRATGRQDGLWQSVKMCKYIVDQLDGFYMLLDCYYIKHVLIDFVVFFKFY